MKAPFRITTITKSAGSRAAISSASASMRAAIADAAIRVRGLSCIWDMTI